MKYLFVVVLVLVSFGCKEDQPKAMTEVELGKHLYFDTRLSADDTVSCNTCHDITGKKGGVDNLPTSVGIKGQKGGRNSPTVWNASLLSTQFWDGRAEDLAAQAKGPITNPIEMGMKDHDAVIEKLKKIPGYVKAFDAVYGKDSFNIDNLATAIAAYEATLVTLNSPYDKYQEGDKSAMSPEAIKGMELFSTIGCTSCHSGSAFAGPKLPVGQGFFMKFPTFTDNNPYIKKYNLMKDEGRFEVTKSESDKHMFRVPTLRNIELTSPYFHNGSVASLDETVRVMAKSQLHKDLSEEEVNSLVAFLKSLTGNLPEIKAPKPL